MASDGDAADCGGGEDEVGNLIDADCESLVSLDDFGWAPQLSQCTGIDCEGFFALLPALRLDLQSESPQAQLVPRILAVRGRIAGVVSEAVKDMHSRGLRISQDEVVKHVTQLR